MARVQPITAFLFRGMRPPALDDLGVVAACQPQIDRHRLAVVLFDSPATAGFAGMCLLVLLQLLVYGTVTFLGSTLVTSALPAAGIAIAAFIGLAIISAIPNVGRFTPPALNDAGSASPSAVQ